MNCATCHHWTRFTDEFEKRYLKAHAGTCSNKRFTYNNELVPINDLAYWNYKSYSAGFATGEDFGCIHWEQEPLLAYEAGRQYLLQLLGRNPSPEDIAQAIKVADHDPSEYTKGWLDAAKELLKCTTS